MPALRLLLATCTLALAACAALAPAGGPVIADGSGFTMVPGGSVVLADQSTLRYLDLVNDSRCAPRVTCIWAGDAELAFEWRSARGAIETFSLHTGRGDQLRAIGERTLALVSVARTEQGAQPEAQLRVDR